MVSSYSKPIPSCLCVRCGRPARCRGRNLNRYHDLAPGPPRKHPERLWVLECDGRQTVQAHLVRGSAGAARPEAASVPVRRLDPRPPRLSKERAASVARAKSAQFIGHGGLLGTRAAPHRPIGAVASTYSCTACTTPPCRSCTACMIGATTRALTTAQMAVSPAPTSGRPRVFATLQATWRRSALVAVFAIARPVAVRVSSAPSRRARHHRRASGPPPKPASIAKASFLQGRPSGSVELAIDAEPSVVISLH